MRSQGYFKTSLEYDKASTFMERGIIPEWFKQDLNKYYKMMKQEVIGHKEKLMIGE